MYRLVHILILVIGVSGCQRLPPSYDIPNHWDKLSPSERQAWLEGYYWGSRNYSMGWSTFPFGYSWYPSPRWDWQTTEDSKHHVLEDRNAPRENNSSEFRGQYEPTEPPNTLSSQSIQCSAGNPCKQFRPR